MTAEDQIIRYLKDKVGLTEADRLIVQMKTEHAHQLAERQRAHHAKQGIPCAGHGCPAIDVINHIDPKETP